MKILIVEDSLERIEWFERILSNHTLFISTNAITAKSYLLNEDFDLIFLDHDLGEHTQTGLDVAQYLCSQSYLYKPNIIVHSMNYDGAKQIESLLSNHVFPVQHIPFNLLHSIIYLVMGA